MALLKTIWRKITSPLNSSLRRINSLTERGKQAGGSDLVMFDKRLAAALGSCDLAAVVHTVHRWSLFNQAQAKNRREKRYWAYNSYADWQKQEFPWASESTVKRWFRKLEDMGVLVSAQFNSAKGDRRKWYRVDEAKLRGLIPGFNWPDGQVKMASPSGQNGLMVGSKWSDLTTTESQQQNPNRDTQTKQTTPAAAAVQEPSPEIKNIPNEILRLPRLTARKAQELVVQYGEKRVMAVVKYAMNAANLNNPAGFVVHELREDRLGLSEEQPKTNPLIASGERYVQGKYSSFIKH